MNYSFMIPTLLVLTVIMGYYFFRPRLGIRLNRAFLAILFISICTELLEFLSTRLNETWDMHAPALLWIANLLFFSFYLTRAYMFFVFTVSVMDARAIRRSTLHLYVYFYMLCTVFTLATPLTRLMFRIEDGFHTGPLYWMLYGFNGTFIIFGLLSVFRHHRELDIYEIISLVSLQVILMAGNIVRFLVPTYVIMNTFSLMAIIVIFISFLNPDLFLFDRYVYNYTAFQALLGEDIRRKRPCRVVGFAIQHYGEYREIFGGKQMDEALKGVDRWLKETFPQLSAFYLRNGFFALVGHNRPDLEAICNTLRKRFAEPWASGTGELRLTVSFVEADTETLDCPADRLINTMTIAQDELSHATEPDTSRSLTDSIEEINRRLEVRRCLEYALEHDDLAVYLQPLVDCRTGRIIAAESLVRLPDGNGGMIRPDLFITLAEREGSIVQLGEQVLTKVCRFIHDNDLDALGIRWINVNLSPVQFTARDIPARFAEILRKYGVSPDKVHLEITEQSMIDFSLLRNQIISLHEHGFEFSLDDYGSGYSNLSRVRQYPFTNIKIDMEVVRNYCRDKDLLLPSMVQAFRKMNFTVTAEGIENEEMANNMKEIGCDYLQGYFFSRPVPMDEFLALCKK